MPVIMDKFAKGGAGFDVWGDFQNKVFFKLDGAGTAACRAEQPGQQAAVAAMRAGAGYGHGNGELAAGTGFLRR